MTFSFFGVRNSSCRWRTRPARASRSGACRRAEPRASCCGRTCSRGTAPCASRAWPRAGRREHSSVPCSRLAAESALWSLFIRWSRGGNSNHERSCENTVESENVSAVRAIALFLAAFMKRLIDKRIATSTRIITTTMINMLSVPDAALDSL